MPEPQSRTCRNCESRFQIDPEGLGFYEKLDVPPPTWCPECRMVRRMTWRNESSLYRRECGLCKKNIITVYHPGSVFSVYCHDCWISDKWDGKEYGVEYDWNKDLFSQFRELLERTPLVSADMKGTMVRSDYGNYNGNCKDCYMCFAVVAGEDSCYISGSEDIKECVDVTRLSNSELCYEAVESEKAYGCAFIERARESSNCCFLFGSSNASDCFMSRNLKNAKYVFRGKQLPPAEYKKAMAEVDLGSFAAVQELRKEFADLRRSALCKYAEMKNAADATGNSIINSKHVRASFDVVESENVKYSIRILKDSRDIYDCQGMFSGELVYESIGCGFSPRRNIFTSSIDVSRNMAYSAMCRNCSDCFGCVGLKDQQYCILNKQYSKEEYGEMVRRIREHMDKQPYRDAKGRTYGYGEFFPPELSPFAYNETIAQDHFPLTREEAGERGYRWQEREKRSYGVTVQPGDLPDNTKDASDAITSEIIGCEHGGKCQDQCTTAFRITPQEFRLYKKMQVPLPRLCPNCRYSARFRQRNPFRLWPRRCQCTGREAENGAYSNNVQHFHDAEACPNKFETTYAPDRPEVVYCEQCYQAELA